MAVAWTPSQLVRGSAGGASSGHYGQSQQAAKDKRGGSVGQQRGGGGGAAGDRVSGSGGRTRDSQYFFSSRGSSVRGMSPAGKAVCKPGRTDAQLPHEFTSRVNPPTVSIPVRRGTNLEGNATENLAPSPPDSGVCVELRLVSMGTPRKKRTSWEAVAPLVTPGSQDTPSFAARPLTDVGEVGDVRGGIFVC